MINIYKTQIRKVEGIKELILLVFLLLVFSIQGMAQTGPCYYFEYSTGNTYDTLTTSPISLYVDDEDYDILDDGISAAIPIGFTFIYNYQPYTKFKVNTNGFITLDENLAWNPDLWWNYLESYTRKLILAPLWDDLVINTGGNIRYELTGTAGDRILKIEFNKLTFWNGGDFQLKFQVWLYEGTNEIEFRYGDDESYLGWRNYSDEGITIGLNDERDTSFMRITPGPEPTYTLNDDTETYFLGMEDYVNNGLVYKFTPASRWQGTTNDQWLTQSNWELDQSPLASDIAMIPKGTPVVSAGGAVCNKLIIESGGDLTVAGLGELTVTGDIMNDGVLTVSSSSENSTGSLIIEGNTNATVNFERYLSGDPNWHLLSSPVSGQEIWSWATNSANDIATNASKYGITTYIEENDGWDIYPSSDPGGDFMLGKGYSTSRQTNGLVTFTGTINTNDITDIPISYANQGWNLIGNPYTSAIGATNSASSAEYLLNAANVDNLDPSYAGLYLWAPASGTSGEFVIINNSGGTPTETLGQDYIQTGQGFFVRAKDNNGRTFDITRTMQEHQPTVPLKSGNLWPAINLKASNGENSSSTLVRFNNSMTRGLDVTYDAGMFKTNPDFAIYTRLVEDNGVDFALQCLPEDYSNLVIPVGLDVPAGTELTFSADLINLPGNCDPYLEDRILGTFIALKSADTYSLTIDESYTNSPSLFLHTSKNTITGSKVVALDDPFRINTNYREGYIRVLSTTKNTALAKVYDTSGRLMAIQDIQQGNNNIIRFSGKPGIYIIQVKNDLHSLNQKIFWKN